jgi:hypothetical protein
MNMNEVAAEQTSSFGAFTLTYLTVEVDGHDSLAAEESMPIPGHNLAGTLAGGSSPFGRTTGADLQRQRR